MSSLSASISGVIYVNHFSQVGAMGDVFRLPNQPLEPIADAPGSLAKPLAENKRIKKRNICLISPR
jgi:hypothetical protein